MLRVHAVGYGPPPDYFTLKDGYVPRCVYVKLFYTKSSVCTRLFHTKSCKYARLFHTKFCVYVRLFHTKSCVYVRLFPTKRCAYEDCFTSKVAYTQPVVCAYARFCQIKSWVGTPLGIIQCKIVLQQNLGMRTIGMGLRQIGSHQNVDWHTVGCTQFSSRSNLVRAST